MWFVTHLQGVGVLVAELLHLRNRFLPLLEPAEVILNEERRVELAHRDVIVA